MQFIHLNMEKYYSEIYQLLGGNFETICYDNQLDNIPI